MSFVPVFIPPPPPSPEATELGHRLAQVVREFEAQNPGAGSTEISQAFSVARGLLRSTTNGTRSPRLIAMVIGVLLLLAGAFALTLFRGAALPTVWPIIVGVGLLGIVLAVVKAKG